MIETNGVPDVLMSSIDLRVGALEQSRSEDRDLMDHAVRFIEEGLRALEQTRARQDWFENEIGLKLNELAGKLSGLTERQKECLNGVHELDARLERLLDRIDEFDRDIDAENDALYGVVADLIDSVVDETHRALVAAQVKVAFDINRLSAELERHGADLQSMGRAEVEQRGERCGPRTAELLDRIRILELELRTAIEHVEAQR